MKHGGRDTQVSPQRDGGTSGVKAGTKTVVPGPYDPSETAQVYTQYQVPLFNTKCPKIGAAQWTCTKSECICHLKESIGL